MRIGNFGMGNSKSVNRNSEKGPKEEYFFYRRDAEDAEGFLSLRVLAGV